MVHHDNPAKHGLCNILIRFLHPHNRIRQPDYSLLLQDLRRFKFLRFRNACKRQKRRASESVFFQENNHFLCRILIVRNNILDISAKRRFNRGFILLINFNNIRYNADNASIFLLLLHHALNAVSIAFIPLRKVGNGIKLCLTPLIFSLKRPDFLIFIGEPLLKSPCLCIQLRKPVICRNNLVVYPAKFLLKRLKFRVKLRLIALCTQQP